MQKILLVEDDPLLQDIYGTKFKEAGFDVVFAESGDKALSQAEKERPDLIVLDIVLPHQDGWEVLRELKAHEEVKKIKVIILSNLGQREEIDKGMELGAAAYLIKAHFTPTQVVEQIRKVLQD